MKQSVTRHLRSWKAHIVGLRLAWHAILSLRQHTRSNNVENGLPSLPLDSTHGRTTSGMASHHYPWAADTGSNYVGCGILSSPLHIIHCRMTSSMTCYHRSWTKHTIILYRAWQGYNHSWEAHAIGRRRLLNENIALGKNTLSDYVRCGKLSSPLEINHNQTTSGVAFSYRP